MTRHILDLFILFGRRSKPLLYGQAKNVPQAPAAPPGDIAEVFAEALERELRGGMLGARVRLLKKGEPPAMLFLWQVEDILDLISYKAGWTFDAALDGDRVYIQASVDTRSDLTVDSTNPDGPRIPWKSGKRYLSPFMCRQEIVGVAFDLIKAAEEHELREWFRYRGSSIYNPHLDPDVLAEVAKRKASFCVRENAMSMEEPSP